MLPLIVYQFYITESKTKQKSPYREAGRNPKIVKEVSMWPNISCVIGGSLVFSDLLVYIQLLCFLYAFFSGAFSFAVLFLRTIMTPSFKNLLFDTPWEKYSLISLLKESHSIPLYLLVLLIFFPTTQHYLTFCYVFFACLLYDTFLYDVFLENTLITP